MPWAFTRGITTATGFMNTGQPTAIIIIIIIIIIITTATTTNITAGDNGERGFDLMAEAALVAAGSGPAVRP